MKTAEQLRFEMDFKTLEGLHKSIRAIQADALNWALGHLDGVSDEWRDIYEKIKELEQYDPR